MNNDLEFKKKLSLCLMMRILIHKLQIIDKQNISLFLQMLRKNHTCMHEGHGEIAMDLHTWWCKPYMPMQAMHASLPKNSLNASTLWMDACKPWGDVHGWTACKPMVWCSWMDCMQPIVWWSWMDCMHDGAMSACLT
jgi:hypothetical protein